MEIDYAQLKGHLERDIINQDLAKPLRRYQDDGDGYDAVFIFILYNG
jgi:hypothetical protein